MVPSVPGSSGLSALREKESRIFPKCLLIPGDGLKQGSTAKAAGNKTIAKTRPLGTGNTRGDVPTQPGSAFPLGNRCRDLPATSALCREISCWQQQDQGGWDGAFPTATGVGKLGRREKKQFVEGHSANQGREEHPASWLLAHASPQALGIFVRSR